MQKTGGKLSIDVMNHQSHTTLLHERKDLLLIIAMLLLALVLYLIYLVVYVKTSTQNSLVSPTTRSPSQIVTPSTRTTIADWKTYTNEQYGFTIKLPQEYAMGCDNFLNKLPLGDTVNSLCFSTGLTPNWFEGPEPPINAFVINVLQRDKEKNFSRFVSDEINTLTKNTKSKYKIDYPIYSKNGSMNISGQQVEIVSGFSPWSKLIFVSHPNDQQVLMIGELEYTDDQNRFEQILVNLQFVDRPRSPQTTKYTDSKFGFEFEYPNNILIEESKEKQQGDLDLIVSLIRGWFEYPYESKLSLLINPQTEIYDIKEVKSKQINGINWKITTSYPCGPDECMPPTYYYQTTHNNNLIVISNLDTVEYEPILQEVLKTFQFTK